MKRYRWDNLWIQSCLMNNDVYQLKRTWYFIEHTKNSTEDECSWSFCPKYSIKCSKNLRVNVDLTHWDWVTHIWVGKLTIIGCSDNGLLPGLHQAIIWTNAGILLIQTLGTSFSEILSEICAFSFTKMHVKMLSVKWQPFCLSLNVLTWPNIKWYCIQHSKDIGRT